MSNQATIANRCVLNRDTEVAGEFVTGCCGPPHEYSIAAPTVRKNCLQWSKKSLHTIWHGQTHAPQQLPALFDHLVGARQERFRYREAERLGGFEIDD